MKTRTWVVAAMALMLATGSASAQMGGWGHWGGGHGWGVGSGYAGPGTNAGPNPAPGYGYGGGYGYGMQGVGGMISGMMGNTYAYGYLDTFTPVTTPQEARTAVQAFLNTANSDLQISEIWEYGSVYKAELSDTNGARAFDILVDKFTGAVSPEMGMSMMLNASYGMGLYRTAFFGANLALTAPQATDAAQQFMAKNALAYVLTAPEVYPGYYKFHTTTEAGGIGMDIMVNGYNGRIWMDTILGLPLSRY